MIQTENVKFDAQPDWARDFRQKFYEAPGCKVKMRITLDSFEVCLYHPARKHKNNKRGFWCSFNGPVSSDQFPALMNQIALIGSDRR